MKSHKNNYLYQFAIGIIVLLMMQCQTSYQKVYTKNELIEFKGPIYKIIKFNKNHKHHNFKVLIKNEQHIYLMDSMQIDKDSNWISGFLNPTPITVDSLKIAKSGTKNNSQKGLDQQNLLQIFTNEEFPDSSIALKRIKLNSDKINSAVESGTTTDNGNTGVMVFFLILTSPILLFVLPLVLSTVR